MQALDLKPLSGVNELRFGMSVDQVIAMLGKPEEEGEIEELLLEKSLPLWHYHHLGLSLFLDDGSPAQLIRLECRNKNMRLFGLEVMGLNLRDFETLLQHQQQRISEREKLPWGETCISCDELGMEAFFSNDRLQAISLVPAA